MRAILCGTALLGSVISDDASKQGSGYEQYMKQHAGDYEKYMKQAGSKASSQQGGDYQQYMKQYAGDYEKYMKQGGSAGSSQQGGDYQQYMKQYAGDYLKNTKQSDSQQQSGNYQKYVKQYAGDYMKYAKQGNGEGNPAADATPLLAVPDAGSQVGSKDAGQGDYQKYMKQYAGDYMKYANQGGSKGSSQQGGDYQQYMKQYAGDYMKYTKQGDSQQQSGNYQQYVKQYAGDYMKYAKQGNSQGDHAAAATPLLAVPDAGSQVGAQETGQGDYQKYMKQYAGDYMKYANQGGSKASSQQGGDYQKYMKQYAGDYMKYAKQGDSQGSSKGSQGDYQQYMKQYAGDYMKYAKQGDQSGSPMPLLAVSAASASDCNTTKELDAWRKDQESNLKYVPEAYRHFPMDRIEKEYKKNLARIEAASNETKADSAEQASTEAGTPADSVAEPTPLFAVSLAGADACNTTKELDAWRKEQEGHLKYVPEAYRHFPMDAIKKAYKKNLARIEAASSNETKVDTADPDVASVETQPESEHQGPIDTSVDLVATATTQSRPLAALAVVGVSVSAVCAVVYRALLASAPLPEYVQRPPAEV